MKNVTLSLDEETYRQARITAAERNQSVSALVRHYLRSLKPGHLQRPASMVDRPMAESIE